MVEQLVIVSAPRIPSNLCSWSRKVDVPERAGEAGKGGAGSAEARMRKGDVGGGVGSGGKRRKDRDEGGAGIDGRGCKQGRCEEEGWEGGSGGRIDCAVT